MLRWALAFAVPGLLLYAACQGTLRSSEALNVDVAFPPRERGEASGLVRWPLLVVVVDGLTAERARGMSSLSDLERKGAFALVEAELPTVSSAAYATLLTGTSPARNGRRTNAALRPVGADSLMDALAAQGRTTRVLSDEVDWWAQLFPGKFDLMEVVLPSDEGIVARALQVMHGAELLVVHLCGVDAAGHAHGAASPEYLAAVEQADAALRVLAWSWWDLGPSRAMAVVSDHGHTARGGHGGAEPEVRMTRLSLRGPGVASRSGRRALEPERGAVERERGAVEGERRARVPDAWIDISKQEPLRLRGVDVAPTLAALLGVAAPTHAEGRAATELLHLSPEALEAITTDEAARSRWYESEWRPAPRAAGALPRGLGAIALLGLVAFACRSRPRAAGLGAAAGLSTAVLALGLMALLSGAPSLSGGPDAGRIALRAATAALVFGVPVALVLARRSPDRDAAFTTLIAFACGAALPALPLFIDAGIWAPRVVLPSPAWTAAPLWLWPIAAGASVAVLAAALARSLQRSRAAPRRPGG